MNGKLIAFSLAMLISAAVVDAAESGQDRYARDLAGAEFSLMSSLMVKTNEKSKYLCTQNEYACIGVDRAELGLGLIASSRNKDASEKLLGLVKYRLDAGLSSDFKCYLSLRKKDILNQVTNFNYQKSARSCVTNFDQAQKRMKGKFALTADQVCRSEKEIKQQMLEIKKLLEAEGSCDD